MPFASCARLIRGRSGDEPVGQRNDLGGMRLARRTVLTIVPATRQDTVSRANGSYSIREVVEMPGFARKVEGFREAEFRLANRRLLQAAWMSQLRKSSSVVSQSLSQNSLCNSDDFDPSARPDLPPPGGSVRTISVSVG